MAKQKRDESMHDTSQRVLRSAVVSIDESISELRETLEGLTGIRAMVEQGRDIANRDSDNDPHDPVIGHPLVQKLFEALDRIAMGDEVQSGMIAREVLVATKLWNPPEEAS